MILTIFAFITYFPSLKSNKFQQWVINISACFLFKSSREMSVLFHVAKTIADTPSPDFFSKENIILLLPKWEYFLLDHAKMDRKLLPYRNVFLLSLPFAYKCGLSFLKGNSHTIQLSWLNSTLPTEHAIVGNHFTSRKFHTVLPL